MSGAVKKFFYAVSVLSGTIIGVGLFSLPFITAKVGLWVMLGYFLAVATIVIIIHQMFAEVALNSPDFLRLPSYAGIYLGKWGKSIASTTAILGFLGSILAYIIVGGDFLANLLLPVLGGSIFLYTFIYFALGAVLIFVGIKAISKIEFLDTVLFIVILAAIFVGGFSLMKSSNLFAHANGAGDFFLPYGAILFSLWGASLIPEVEEILKEKKFLLKKAIPVAILIPAIFYFLFILAVTSISGAHTSPEAITGLRAYLSNNVILLLLIFGLVATFTSYVALGLTLRKIFCYDLKIPRNISWAIACFVPFLLYLAGFKDFIKIIGLIGGVMLATDGILIALMYQKIKGKKFWVYPLIILLALGIGYEIVYFIS